MKYQQTIHSEYRDGVAETLILTNEEGQVLDPVLVNYVPFDKTKQPVSVKLPLKFIKQMANFETAYYGVPANLLIGLSKQIVKMEKNV